MVLTVPQTAHAAIEAVLSADQDASVHVMLGLLLLMDAQTVSSHLILGALRERRPPWLRQIITPILDTVKMLSLGGQRLTPKVLDHYLHHDLLMLQLLCFVCSFIHLRRPRSPLKFYQFFLVLPRTPP